MMKTTGSGACEARRQTGSGWLDLQRHTPSAVKPRLTHYENRLITVAPKVNFKDSDRIALELFGPGVQQAAAVTGLVVKIKSGVA
jgi:hypothetical protein